jgi:hypothetical protein
LMETVNASNGYSGTVTLSCSLTSSPTGATDLPGCSVPGMGTVTFGTGPTSITTTLTISTTAATASLVRPDFSRNATSLAGLGVAALALLTLLGIPARRCKWRNLLGMLALLVALGSLASCGGGSGSGSSGGSGTKNPGTSAGVYTFTVTGSGNPAITPAPTTTFTLTVN